VTEPDASATNYEINLPESKREGHSADFASIWHTADTFVLDFIAQVTPRQPPHEHEGQLVSHVAADVVTRVRIPASQVWEIMKALEQQYTAWESETGRRPGNGVT